MFDHSVFYILPLFVPLLQGYILALLCLKHSLTTSKSRNNIGHLNQKPECPACQKENSAEPIPEKPPVIEHHLGRHKCVDTKNHYCPNPNCSYYTTWKVIYENSILICVYTFVGAHSCALLQA